MNQPRLVISGLSGSSGKTLVSLSLARVFTRLGLSVQPCKKGPDYIDAAWMGLAAGRPAVNLDPYFLSPDELRIRFALACRTCCGGGQTTPSSPSEPSACDIALVEGNRGLYDGRDVTGSCSTAQVAQILDAPVLLTVNCAKMTRTAAALVSGVQAFDPGLRLGGVILNNTGSARHAALVRKAIETYTDVPVLGALPRLRDNPLPERHMGLSLASHTAEVESVLERLADYVSLHADLEAILALARSSPPLAVPPGLLDSFAPLLRSPETDSERPRIGYVHDEVLWFYYRENLEELTRSGAKLIRLSLLDDTPWPELDGLYLGGGFPELHAEVIASSPHLPTIRAMSEAGAPIYAECGGFMILGQALHIGDKAFPMAGIFPTAVRFFPRPQGLGYVEAHTVHPNPFHPVGSIWRGHEFHYSACEAEDSNLVPPLPPILSLSSGTGMGMTKTPTGSSMGQDGLCIRNTFASYTHLYAPAVPHWATHFVEAARNAMASHYSS